MRCAAAVFASLMAAVLAGCQQPAQTTLWVDPAFYPSAVAFDAARDYAARKGRRVTFEYACIEGVNDSPEHANLLAARLTGFRGGTHVNLIPLNTTAGYRGRGSARVRIEAFAVHLRSRGVEASVRRNRGVDIDAACGQLRARSGPGRTRAPESATMGP